MSTPGVCPCGWHVPVLDLETEDGSDVPPLRVLMYCPLCRREFRGTFGAANLAFHVPPEPTEREMADDRAATLAEEKYE
jgi:hypothetical protein